MCDMRKKYDEAHGAYGRCGEAATKAFFERMGFHVTHLPDGKFGADIYCESNSERFYCGTELRTGRGSWSIRGDRFPYPTYNFLERRAKSDESLLVCWREDMKRGIIVFGCDVRHFPVIRMTNRFAANEDMRQIPIERCLPISMEDVSTSPIAVQNARRVRLAVVDRDMTPDRKLRHLEPSVPYGISSTEYSDLLHKCGKDLIGQTNGATGRRTESQKMLFEISPTEQF